MMDADHAPFKKNKIPLAIAEDHTLVRKGIIEVLLGYDDFDIIIEAGNGSDLIEKLMAVKLLPSICIMDIAMPVQNGYSALVEIKKRWPRIKVLVLSMYKDEYSIVNMIEQGANGYLVKGCDPKELVKALRHLHTHDFYLSEIVNSVRLQNIKSRKLEIPQLNKKEIEILKLISQELTYREIAEKTGINFRTLEGYRDRLFEKFKVSSRIGLVLFALQIGILNEK